MSLAEYQYESKTPKLITRKFYFVIIATVDLLGIAIGAIGQQPKGTREMNEKSTTSSGYGRCFHRK